MNTKETTEIAYFNAILTLKRSVGKERKALLTLLSRDSVGSKIDGQFQIHVSHREQGGGDPSLCEAQESNTEEKAPEHQG